MHMIVTAKALGALTSPAPSNAIGSVMFTAAALLAAMQEATEIVPHADLGSLVQFLVSALAAGGIGTFLIKLGASEYSKSRDAQRAADAEERAQEAAERERRYTDHKDTTARLIASYDGQVMSLREQLAAERERYDRLVATVLPHAPAE